VVLILGERIATVAALLRNDKVWFCTRLQKRTEVQTCHCEGGFAACGNPFSKTIFVNTRTNTFM